MLHSYLRNSLVLLFLSLSSCILPSIRVDLLKAQNESTCSVYKSSFRIHVLYSIGVHNKDKYVVIETYSQGSGVLIKHNNKKYILSSAHIYTNSYEQVIKRIGTLKRLMNNKSLVFNINTKVVGYDYWGIKHPLKIKKLDNKTDLLMLEVVNSKNPTSCFSIISNREIKQYTKVQSFSYPHNKQNKNSVFVYEGIYLGDVLVNMDKKTLRDASLYSLTSYPGSSGGGIIQNGEIIGIIMGIDKRNNTTFGVPLKQIIKFVQ